MATIERNRHIYLIRLLPRVMAQPFRRAWVILKQGPYDHQNPDERPRGLYPPYSEQIPTDWPPYDPRPYEPHPDDPSDWPPRPDIEPYDPHRRPHTQPNPFDPSSRIAEIQTQIQRLEAELQRLLQMQAGAGGGGHPWER